MKYTSKSILNTKYKKLNALKGFLLIKTLLIAGRFVKYVYAINIEKKQLF